jgi:hypothetical protein
MPSDELANIRVIYTVMANVSYIVIRCDLWYKHRSRCFDIMGGHDLFFLTLDTLFDFRLTCLTCGPIKMNLTC